LGELHLISLEWFFMVMEEGRVQEDFTKLLSRKLDEALKQVDLRVFDRFQAFYSQITPASSCPFCSTVMAEVKEVCVAGVKERGEVAADVVLGLLDSIRIPLSVDLVDRIFHCVRQKMPEDLYVAKACHIQDMYARRACSDNKFQERPYEIELSAIQCGSANLSRQAVGHIKTMLDERLLKSRVETQLVEPVALPKPAALTMKRAPWTREHRLGVIAIVVAVVAAAVGTAATLYPQETKAFFHLGR
jgi:hypothetical protein